MPKKSNYSDGIQNLSFIRKDGKKKWDWNQWVKSPHSIRAIILKKNRFVSWNSKDGECPVSDFVLVEEF